MPRWKEKDIHSFRRHQEEASLKWTDDEETRAVVLDTVDAILEVIESHELGPAHLDAFVASATHDHSNYRAWLPGTLRLVQMLDAFPEQARPVVEAMLDEPRLAARFLTVGMREDLPFCEQDQERALQALAALSLDEQRALMPEYDRSTETDMDPGYDKVRRRLQQRAAGAAPPRSVTELVEELRAYSKGKSGRDCIVIMGELEGRIEPEHIDSIIALIVEWDVEGVGSDLAGMVAETDGGIDALIAAFERTPNDALIDFVFRLGEYDRDGEALLRAALGRELPDSARRDIESLLEGE